jgi:hypothetical protein
MTEPQHRRPKRSRGVRLHSTPGRRRSSGAIEAETASREELSQRRRRDDVRHSRSKIFLAILVAVAIVWATVLLTTFDRTDGNDDPAAPVADPVSASGASVLVAVTDPDDRATTIALIAAVEGAKPRAVLLPPSLLATLPGFGEGTLSNTTRFDGPELLEVTVANLLGARIDATVTWDADDLAVIVDAPLLVDVPTPLVERQGDSDVVVYAAGEAERSHEDLYRLFTDRGGDDELTWMQRQAGALDGLLNAAAARPAVVESMLGRVLGDQSAARTAFTEASGDVAITAVPALRIEPTGREELYQLSGEIAAEFVSDSIGYLRIAPEPRTRVEVLNGNGQIGTVRPVAGALIRRGYRVILTDNADRLDYAETRVIAQGRAQQQAAVDIAEIIGLGRVSAEVRQPSGVVDVTIIVGRDLATNGG